MSRPYTVKSLRELAAEMNSKVGLDPAIDTKLRGDALIAAIKKEVGELVKTDKISAGGKKVLSALKVGPWYVPDAKPDAKPEPNTVAMVLAMIPAAPSARSEEMKDRRKLLTQLIEAGKWTRQEVAEKLIKAYPTISASSAATMITDSKNAKYNKLAKLAKMDKATGIYSF